VRPNAFEWGRQVTTEQLARRIEETPIGPFAILLGLTEDHFSELVEARRKIADALRLYESTSANGERG